uniref:Spef2_0 protein n=1 Tax=Fopius arisanus TaxID=64838 RepID=A0A0C9R1W0_9HYME
MLQTSNSHRDSCAVIDDLINRKLSNPVGHEYLRNTTSTTNHAFQPNEPLLIHRLFALKTRPLVSSPLTSLQNISKGQRAEGDCIKLSSKFVGQRKFSTLNDKSGSKI